MSYLWRSWSESWLSSSWHTKRCVSCPLRVVCTAFVRSDDFSQRLVAWSSIPARRRAPGRDDAGYCIARLSSWDAWSRT
jgi:hypothetical protein